MLRRLVLSGLLTCALAAPVQSRQQPIQPRTGGVGGTPTMTGLTGNITAGDPAGTAAASPAVAGLSCSWTLSPATYFTQNSSTGAVVTSSTPTSAGTYTPVSTCTASSGGQTITVAAALSIVAAPGSYSPSLDFSDSRNSQYYGAII